MSRAKAGRRIVSAVEHDSVFRAAPDAEVLPLGGNGEVDSRAAVAGAGRGRSRGRCGPERQFGDRTAPAAGRDRAAGPRGARNPACRLRADRGQIRPARCRHDRRFRAQAGRPSGDRRTAGPRPRSCSRPEAARNSAIAAAPRTCPARSASPPPPNGAAPACSTNSRFWTKPRIWRKRSGMRAAAGWSARRARGSSALRIGSRRSRCLACALPRSSSASTWPASRSRRAAPARREASSRAARWRRSACPAAIAENTIRVSFGWTTTAEDIRAFQQAWLDIAAEARMRAA